MAGVSELLGGIPLWGGSSSTGVFRDAGWVTSDGGAASLMLIADRSAGVGVVDVGDDPCAAGKKATEDALKQLGGPASALLTLAFMGPEEELLQGIAIAAPGVPVVGGSASDHSPAGKFEQFANGHAYKDHFAIAALGGTIGYAFTNGYRLTGKKATVTKATGRTLFELDGRRAMDVYCGVGRKARSGDRRRRPRLVQRPVPAPVPTRTGSRTPPTRSTATRTARWTSGRPCSRAWCWSWARPP